MKKILFLLICFLSLINVLKAKVIAKVGDFDITSSELNYKISQLPDTLKFRKQIAYRLLVDEKLFLNYAKENDITVSESELDDFFISQLGDDPTLLTNGEFDYDKYLKLKRSERGKKILNIMKNDILIKKSKDLVIENFDITDDTLLDKFIVNSLNVDLDYAILNVDYLDISKDCTREGAIRYYSENSRNYKTKSGKIFRFTVKFFKDFTDSAKVITQKKINTIADSLYSPSGLDSLKTKIFQNVLDSLTYQAALRDYKLFRSSKEDSLVCYDTYPVRKNSTFDSFPKDFYANMDLGDISLPIKTDYGYITLKYLQDTQPKVLPLDKVRYKVWKNYINLCNKNEEILRAYFQKHIDDFYVSASMVEILKLPKDTKKIPEIQRKFFNDEKTKYNKNIIRKILFLNRFDNGNNVYDLIAKKIKNATERGIAEDNENFYLFKEILNFPEYLPNFDDIKEQLVNINGAGPVDTLAIKKYYENNKSNLVAPDSVKLGFAYFPFDIDTIKVDQSRVKDYFINHRSEFKREVPAISLDYIALPDSITAKKVEHYLNRGDDFNRLKMLYNTNKKMFKTKEISLTSVDDTLRFVLSNTPLKSFSVPFYYKGSWVIVYKKNFYNNREKKFDEVKEDIEKMLKLQEARKVAYERTKVVFDSTRYYSDCLKYVNKKDIFQTDFQDFDMPFYILGDMSVYKDELMRIWKNVKLTSIVEADSGYAIVFLLKKKYHKKLSFEEAKPKIIKILAEENKLKNALKQAKRIRQEVINSQNPDSVLYFLGKWYKMRNLKLNSLLPGLSKKLSSLVLLDVSKHNTGYISPILKLDIKHLLFYRIEKLQKISKSEFYKNKNKIRANLVKEKLKEWLSDYKKKIPIKFYGY